MKIESIFTIDNLTTESVSVKKQKVLTDGDTVCPLGEPVRTAFTKYTLAELTETVPEPYLSAVEEVWGARICESGDSNGTE